MSAARDYINAILTLMALVVVVPFVLTAAAAYMVWDMCFGKSEAQGGEAWESSEWE
jgi:hypothetical protein